MNQTGSSAVSDNFNHPIQPRLINVLLEIKLINFKQNINYRLTKRFFFSLTMTYYCDWSLGVIARDDAIVNSFAVTNAESSRDLCELGREPCGKIV